jgi:hypothetical protein
MMPGATIRRRVDHAPRARGVRHVADRRDPPARDRDVGAPRASPVPSTTIPPRITRS